MLLVHRESEVLQVHRDLEDQRAPVEAVEAAVQELPAHKVLPDQQDHREEEQPDRQDLRV